MTLKVTFAVCNLSNLHTSGNVVCIIYDMFTNESKNARASVNFNYLFENEGLIKVTCSHVHCKCGNTAYLKRCHIESLLLQTTNSKCYIAHRIEANPMTLSDLQGHWPTSSLFNCDFSYSCAAVDKISSGTARRGPLR